MSEVKVTKKKSVSFSFTFGTCFILTVILLAIKYGFAPTIPMWIALLPMMVWVGLLAAIVMSVLGALTFAGCLFALASIVEVLEKRRRKKKNKKNGP